MRSGYSTGGSAFVRLYPDKNIQVHDPACLSAYQWLVRAPAPRMVGEGILMWKAIAADRTTTKAHINEEEVAAALRRSNVPSYDPNPRAGLVLAVIARRARKTAPDTPQCALNWATFGTEAGQPRLGDVVCSRTEIGFWVGLYVGEDDVAYHLLGVTEEDRIGVERVAKLLLYAVRRPLYEGTSHAPCGIQLNRDGTLYG